MDGANGGRIGLRNAFYQQSYSLSPSDPYGLFDALSRPTTESVQARREAGMRLTPGGVSKRVFVTHGLVCVLR